MTLNQIFNYFTWTLVAAIWATASQAATPVRQCGNAVPLPLQVDFDDCAQLPCDVLKGSHVNVAIQFVATKNVMRQLTAKVHMTTLGVTIPYDLGEQQSNVCNNLLHDAYCPLYAGEDVTYALVLLVSENQPEVPTKMEITLLDAVDNTAVACFIADTRVKKPGHA